MLPGAAMAAMLMGADLVSGFHASAFPASANKTQGFSDGVSHTLVTPTVTVTPSGGVGPFTYGWVRQSGDSAITAASPSTAATSFSASLASDETKTAVFRCTVTDTVTGATTFVDVNVALHYVGFA